VLEDEHGMGTGSDKADLCAGARDRRVGAAESPNLVTRGWLVITQSNA
jgi:hypothetical protein